MSSSPLRYIAALALVASSAGAQTVVVTSPPVKTVVAGDESDPSALDTWLRNNVRSGSSIGVSSTYPSPGGTGSMYMNGTIAGVSKADAEYFFGGAVLSPFALGALQSATYDIFRAAGSTTAANQNPSLRFLVDADGNTGTTTDRGYLIFEGANNGVGSLVDNTWTTMTVGSTSNLWFRQFSPGFSDYSPSGIGRTLADYQDGYVAPNGSVFGAGSLVYGISSGIGSGWSGSWQGGVDNITLDVAGLNAPVRFDFEASARTTVPEPASLVLFGTGALGLVGLAARRRRQS